MSDDNEYGSASFDPYFDRVDNDVIEPVSGRRIDPDAVNFVNRRNFDQYLMPEKSDSSVGSTPNNDSLEGKGRASYGGGILGFGYRGRKMSKMAKLGCLSVIMTLAAIGTMPYWYEPVKNFGTKLVEDFNKAVSKDKPKVEASKPAYNIVRETDTLTYNKKTKEDVFSVLKEYRDSTGEKSYASYEYIIGDDVQIEKIITDKNDLKMYEKLKTSKSYQERGEAFFISDFSGGAQLMNPASDGKVFASVNNKKVGLGLN